MSTSLYPLSLGHGHVIFDFLEGEPGYKLKEGDEANQPEIEGHRHEHLTVVEKAQHAVDGRLSHLGTDLFTIFIRLCLAHLSSPHEEGKALC